MKKKYLLLFVYTIIGAFIGSILFEFCNIIILIYSDNFQGFAYHISKGFWYRFLFSIPFSFLFIICFIKKRKNKNLNV
ncbi:MAG: hypothetical protein EAZ08_01465 [Cytophagales bacterium]|nr:MAG: hypothetical protein EAZ08_01465 [Cytophagales bacterium]